ncbi:MAG: CBS domain-containing protein [Candidatus Thorarchaeota archaeon]|nr:MAG: CBS domain-containing protein [Candidatus Thorarchaeota archaeon]
MSSRTHSMSGRDIMEVNVVTMPPDAIVRDVASRMAQMDIGSIIIMDRTRPVGIITESDIARRLVAEEKDPK